MRTIRLVVLAAVLGGAACAPGGPAGSVAVLPPAPVIPTVVDLLPPAPLMVTAAVDLLPPAPVLPAPTFAPGTDALLRPAIK